MYNYDFLMLGYYKFIFIEMKIGLFLIKNWDNKEILVIKKLYFIFYLLFCLCIFMGYIMNFSYQGYKGGLKNLCY